MVRNAAILILTMALAACGVRADLKPQAGKELPQAPYGREAKPSSAQLLVPPQQAAPERSVELRKRSEARADDPFALPPKE
jgi:hypothetical protein